MATDGKNANGKSNGEGRPNGDGRLVRLFRRVRRTPAWLAVPGGLLLIVGGIFGFLPVLGFWMIPLGLLVIAPALPRTMRRRMLQWARGRNGRRGQ
jgi:hypothetical protein